MKIGIEHEIGVINQARTLKMITGSESYMSSLNIYTEVKEGLEIAYDKEYYPTQYEVKFKPFEPTVENINFVTNHLANLYRDTDTIQNNGPDFVGTHIHIFNEYGYSSKGLLQVTERVFREMVEFWTEIYEDERLAKKIKRAELARLITSNNLLKFFDKHTMRNSLESIMALGSTSFQYRNVGENKSKYSPVIWSEERGGKPYSLELRYISNTYLLLADGGKIQELITDCVSIVETQTEKEEYLLDETSEVINKIANHYLSLTFLYDGICTNMSLRHVEGMILKFISTKPITESTDRLRLISEANMRMISQSEFLDRSNELRNGSRNRQTPFDIFIVDDSPDTDDNDNEEESD